MPSATVRCTRKAFLRLLFLMCISLFLFTLLLPRDCDKKKNLNNLSSALRVKNPVFCGCQWVCLCVWAEGCLCVYQIKCARTVLTAYAKVSRWTHNREAPLSSSHLQVHLCVITPSPSSPPRFHPSHLIHNTRSAPSLGGSQPKGRRCKIHKWRLKGNRCTVVPSRLYSWCEYHFLFITVAGRPALQCMLAGTRMKKCAVKKVYWRLSLAYGVLLVSWQSSAWLCTCVWVRNAFFFLRFGT